MFIMSERTVLRWRFSRSFRNGSCSATWNPLIGSSCVNKTAILLLHGAASGQKMEHMMWNRGRKEIHRPAVVCCWTNKGFSLLSLRNTLMGFITDHFVSSSIMKKEEGYSLSICADSAYFIRVYAGVAHTHNRGRPTNPHCWQNGYFVQARWRQ